MFKEGLRQEVGPEEDGWTCLQEEFVFPDPKAPIGQIVLDSTAQLPKKEESGDLVLFSFSLMTGPHRV